MSCYDYVVWEDKKYMLPDSLVVGNTVFQTQSGNSVFSVYEISRAGRLYLDGNLVVEGLCLNFYVMSSDRVLHEYDAYFQQGVLQSVGVVL